jgi:hypothetical protein
VAAKHCEFMLGGATVQLRRLGANWPGPAAKGLYRKNAIARRHDRKLPL